MTSKSSSSDDPFTKLLIDLQQEFDRLLIDSIKKLKSDLFKKTTMRDKNVNQADIDEGCNQICDLVKQRFEINIDKFELYSRRNLLSKFALRNQKNNQPSAKKNKKNNNDSMYQEDFDQLVILRESYVQLQHKYNSLNKQKDELDSLFFYMNKLMFNIRVAKQSFEEEPLDSSISLIQEQFKELDSLSYNAHNLESKILQVSNFNAMNGPFSVQAGAGQRYPPVSVKVFGDTNIADINKLTSNIRRT